MHCPWCGSEAPPRWFPFVVGYEHKGSRGGQALWGIGREIEDVAMSLCVDCGRPALWHAERQVWPSESSAPPPATGTPPVVRATYEEARRAFDASPRSAAALLRLSLRDLFELAGLPDPAAVDDGDAAAAEGASRPEGGADASAARWTLPASVVQALRDVRAAGGDAVSPGLLDLRDDRETALALFVLVNALVVRLVTEPAAWRPGPGA